MKYCFGWLIIMYQKITRCFNISSCRYSPTCSEYMREAIFQYGVFKGIGKGAWRILRCHQFSPGGYDPVI